MSKNIPISEVVKSVSITHKFNKSHLLFLNTSDIEGGKIINKNYLPVSELKGQAKKTIKKNDILFSEIRPKNRRFAYVDFDDTEDYVVSTKLMVLRNINSNVDNKYFYYFLTNDGMLNILQNRAENRICSFPQITYDLLSEYKIRVPELEEQQKIATVLSTLDSKIELNNRINVELEAMAKTVYDYWFVQFDFPNDEGKPYKTSGGKMVWNKELKREIPEGWEVNYLTEIADTSSGGTPLSTNQSYYINGEIPWVNSGELNNSLITNTSNYITEIGLKNSSAKLFQINTILVALYGATAGKVSLLKIPACTNQAICAVIAKSDNFHNYLYFFFSNLYRYLVSLSTGSARDNLSQEIIRKLKLTIPPKHLIEQFGSLANPIFDKITLNIRENQQLSSLRDWLLPMLMNGQVRVE